MSLSSIGEAQTCVKNGVNEGCQPPLNPQQCFPVASGPSFWQDVGGFQTWQYRRAIQSPNNPACEPVLGESIPSCCGGLPPGSVTPSVSIRIVGKRVFIDYDAPGLYCTDTGEWPPNYTCFNDPMIAPDRLTLSSPGLGGFHWAFIYFEHGTWDTGYDIPCGSTESLQGGIGYAVAPGNIRVTALSGFVNLTAACPDRDVCPGGTSVALPINVGSGDVSIGQPLFSVAQEPMPLPFTLTYHSSLAMFPSLITSEPVGKGWTHDYNQILKPEAGTGGNRLYRLTAEGHEEEYLRIGAATTWIAINPGELRGTVAQVASDYQLTDLNGTVTTFDVTTGRWKSTKDRWGNTISGTYNGGGQLTTITDSMGRQTTLAYTSGLVTITLPSSQTWKLTLSGSNLLTAIRDPLHPTTDWRTYSYANDHTGVQRLLTSIKDDASKELEAHTYDNTAGTGTDRGLTSSQAGGTRSNVSIAYDSPGPGQRTVTHAIGGSTNQTTTFNVSYLVGRWLPTQISGSCATCGGADADLQVFTYDYSNHVITKLDGSGADEVETRYTYDGNGMPLQKLEAVGKPEARTTTYTYAAGTPPNFRAPWPAFATSVTEPSAAKPGAFKTTMFTWSNSGSCAGAGPENCLQTTVSGYLKSADSAPTPYTTTTVFDSLRHRVTAIKGPGTNEQATHSYFADAATNNGGRRQTSALYTSVTAHLDTTFLGYDLYGTPGTTTDANSVQTQRTTDARGRLLTVVSKKPASDPNEPPDYTTSYAYDTRDRLTSTTLPLGNKLAFQYEDGTNRLLNTIRVNSTGNQQERLALTLDTIGNKTQENAQKCTTPAVTCSAWAAAERTESFGYNVHNRLSSITHPVGGIISYTYDTRGNLKDVKDERHATANTFYLYDALNRLTRVTQTLAGAPAVSGSCPASAGNISTCYAHDLHDNLVSVKDPNLNETIYEYDDFGRLQKQISPVTGTTTYSFDAAGNLQTSNDANSAATTRTYDAANRVLSASSARSGFATEVTTYIYDEADPPSPHSKRYGKGRLTSMTDPSGSVLYFYERRGLPRAEDKTIEKNTYTLRFGYDGNGNRTRITYPSGRAVNYAFDFADRPTQASSGATNYVSTAAYRPFGPLSQVDYGNGTRATMTHDMRYRMTVNKLEKLAPPSTIAQSTYTLDGVGNITAITDVTAAYNRTFAYDDLNRITTANSGASLWGTAGGNGYAYDAMGNLTSLTLGTARTATFTYQQNASAKNLPRLASVTETGPGFRAVAYDAAGNETSVGPSTFAYSARNFLSSADTRSYTYDGRGVRAVTTLTATVFPVSVSAAPSSVVGATASTGTITLNDLAPGGGALINLQSSDTNVATVPATTTVAAGQASGTFTITTLSVTSDTKVIISATHNGNGVTTSVVLAVTTAPRLVGVSVAPRTVRGGTASTGTVTLNGPAPVGGASVTLTSSNPAVASVPASVLVAQNQTSATFAITTSTVTSSNAITISATYLGVTQRVSLTVVSVVVEGFSTEEFAIGSLLPRKPLLLASLLPLRPGDFRALFGSQSEVSLFDTDPPGTYSFPAVFLDSAGDPAKDVSLGAAAAIPGPPKRNFLYSPELSLLAESEVTSPRERAILYEYIWFNGRPVAQVDGSTATRWTFTDHLGTPIVLTNAAGTVFWRAEHEPYGRVFALRPPTLADQHQPMRFPGQEAEQFNLGTNGATERSYNIFRWYRPGWGRYTQSDPVGLWPSTHLYAYVDSNPLVWIDLLGLCTICCNDYDRDKLHTRLDQATKLQAAFLRNTPAPPPGEVQVGGVTYCSEGPNGRAAPGTVVTTMTRNSPGVCINACSKRHEQSHRDLCSRRGVQGFIDLGRFVEVLGYAEEIHCLTQSILTGTGSTCGINF